MSATPSDAPPHRMAKYKQLGSSGLRVSVPILGCMSYGSSQWQPWILDEDEALPMLKAAYDRGITTWDTANVYSNGASEDLIAKAIAKYAIPRAHLTLLTKCNGLVRASNDPATLALPNPKSLPEYQNQYGLSRAAIFHAVDASLARLRTPYIDLLQIHRYDPAVPPAETMRALHDLVAAGKVRYLGASSMHAYQFATLQFTARMHGWTEFVSMQNHVSLLYREEEREMLRLCAETGVGVIPWSPLAFGVLARPAARSFDTLRGQSIQGFAALDDAGAKIVAAVEKVAAARGTSMSAVALAWAARKTTSPIVGASKVERLDDALEGAELELTEEEVEELEKEYKPRAVAWF